MIVSLSCNKHDKEFLIGTKSSDIFMLKIGDDFSKARKVMSGHSEGTLWGLAIDQSEPFFYTGGDDQRLMKWEYRKTCLLYTSPSPRDLSTSRMPSSA